MEMLHVFSMAWKRKPQWKLNTHPDEPEQVPLSNILLDIQYELYTEYTSVHAEGR